jgi:hypothetical protein
MTDDIDEQLHKINKSLDRLLGYDLNPEMEERKVSEETGLTPDEVQTWLMKEPNFTKRIATPPPTKQRRRVTLRNKIYMRLLLMVTNLVSEVN